MVGSNDPRHRIEQLEQLVGTLNRKLNEALRDLANAQRLVEAYESTTPPENRPRSLADDLDAALKVPDIFDAVFALTVRSEAWAHDAISGDLFAAFNRHMVKEAGEDDPER